jgi:hypothetical protein
VKECPVDMSGYFKVCNYAQNHRTLMDFELVFWYVEQLEAVRPGSLKLFQNYLVMIKPLIVAAGKGLYAA